MHKPHFSKCKCEDCLQKALHYVVKGTGLDPDSEKWIKQNLGNLKLI